MPTTYVDRGELEKGIPVFILLETCGLAKSRGAARRLIEQGGAYKNNERVEEVDCMATMDDLGDGGIVLRSGKKRYHKILIKG